MRLYLSSFRLGDHPERLVAMVPEPRRIAVICNAIDNEPDERPGKVAAEIGWLRDLGLDPTEVDLRTDDPAGLAAYQAVWVRGGNVFVLREAMRRGGADEILTDLIRTDKIVYAGYSAGPCVLAPSLRGLELCDDITAVVEPIWTGLGVLDQAFLPHLDSPLHPETELIARVKDLYDRTNTPYIPLRDGQALIINGPTRDLL